MRQTYLTILTALMTITVLLCRPLEAQESNCGEIAAMSAMSSAKSEVSLSHWKQRAGTGYRVGVVYASRLFELKPDDRNAASGLLALVPPNKQKESDWHTFGDSLCDSEPLSDMKALAKLQARLPRDLARAVLVVPEKMLDYVSYAYASIQYPDSDYAVQMRMVCRAKHAEFSSAVNKLDADDRKWFVGKILNPDGCRVLTLPEAG